MRNIKKPTKVQEPDSATGLSVICASEIKPCAPPDLRGVAPDHPVMVAIRAQFPASHPSSQRMIFRRYTEFYKNIPDADAVEAIQRGYSSPSAAMSDRVIRRRRYVGMRGAP